MPSAIRIVSPQLQVPVLDAPRLKAIDVSSGLESVADGLDQLGRVEQAAKLNEAQITLSGRFRDLANELQSTPAEHQRQLFEQRAAQIQKDVLGGIDDKPARDAAASDFQKSYAVFGARVDHDAWKGMAASTLTNADEEAQRLVEEIADARAPHERNAAVERLGQLYGNLAAVNIIDDTTRRGRIEEALNDADVVAVRRALDDPNHDPAQVARALRERSQYFHLSPLQALRWAKRLDNEAVRRKTTAAAERDVADRRAEDEAPAIVRDNIQSLLSTGRTRDDGELAVLDRLPPERRARAHQKLDVAERVFSAVGNLAAKSADEIERALGGLKTQSEDVREQARNYADDVLRERDRDPAAAADASIPSVASACATYDAEQTPGNLQSAVRQSLAAQAKLGIARDHRRPLSGERAETEARAILAAPLEKQLEALRATRLRFGALSGEVEHQIDPFLPAKLREAASQESALKGDLMWGQVVAEGATAQPRGRLGVESARAPSTK